MLRQHITISSSSVIAFCSTPEAIKAILATTDNLKLKEMIAFDERSLTGKKPYLNATWATIARIAAILPTLPSLSLF